MVGRLVSSFLLGRTIFRCKILVSGSVYNQSCLPPKKVAFCRELFLKKWILSRHVRFCGYTGYLRVTTDDFSPHNSSKLGLCSPGVMVSRGNTFEILEFMLIPTMSFFCNKVKLLLGLWYQYTAGTQIRNATGVWVIQNSVHWDFTITLGRWSEATI